VYAHRGGAALRPENTFAAFDHGLALGADGLELDVHLTRDGAVVVHHDPDLERTTSGTGRIAARALAELGALDAAFNFTHPDSKGFPFRGQGVRIPTLQEVLDRYPEVPLIVELKSSQPELARRVIELVRAAGALHRVALGSFYSPVLKAARAMDPGVATGASSEETRWALYRSWVGIPLGRRAYREFQVPERSGRTTIVTPRFVTHAHRAGVGVKVWTVDERADIDRLLSWGVDGIITDRPDVAVAALRAQWGQTGVRPGSDRGQTGVKPGSDPGRTPV
jgi:glycerophosphoryl diester phosphodiesterase